MPILFNPYGFPVDYANIFNGLKGIFNIGYLRGTHLCGLAGAGLFAKPEQAVGLVYTTPVAKNTASYLFSGIHSSRSTPSASATRLM